MKHRASMADWTRAALTGLLVLAMAGPLPAMAARERAAKEAPTEPQQQFSKEFVKKAVPVQKLVNDKKWPEVLAALPEIEAIPTLNLDDRKVLSGWKLQALQATGDTEGLMAGFERFLADGFAAPEQVGALHQQLAAWYNSKKDNVKALEHYQAFIDATPDAEAKEIETLARLYLQNNRCEDADRWLVRVIDNTRRAGKRPDELWFQLRDRCLVELKRDDDRLANLEALVAEYPSRDYYSRVVALYRARSGDDKVVMLNAFRVAVSDPLGGLGTVGSYLAYADVALVMGSPGEAVRALERGMREEIVPDAGSNQAALQEARAALAADSRNLAADAAAAAKSAKGEVEVKVGLGYFSKGDYARTVELVRSGLTRGGVARVDDAQLLLGAALLELGRTDEARAAFEAAAAAGSGSLLGRIAGLWLARLGRVEPAAAVDESRSAS
ncbi:MAG: tetratricopeptide repeat protein [Gammaproteobacteria bacterium]|nr:MAG: tetratricopeptide repeat protein [Gammaproteobacteria bacterium]